MDLLPLSKKHLKSYAVLELLNNTTFVQDFIGRNLDRSNDDIKDIYTGLQDRYKEEIRCHGYRGWLIAQKLVYEKLRKNKRFILGERLSRRELDTTSSQYSSAKILLMDNFLFERTLHHSDKISDQIAYTCRILWNIDKVNLDVPDPSESEQFMFYMANTYLNPNNPENIPLQVVFGYMTIAEAVSKFPQIKHHESDRSISIPRALAEMRCNTPISTDDHRVVKAIAMYCGKHGIPVKFEHPECVSKSNPNFWECLEQANIYIKSRDK